MNFLFSNPNSCKIPKSKATILLKTLILIIQFQYFLNNTHVLVLEKCQCSLQDMLDKNEHFDHIRIIDWFNDMANIVNYFHNGKVGKNKKGILYRDFKVDF